jgi:cyclin-dependent kinase inhibitor 3
MEKLKPTLPALKSTPKRSTSSNPTKQKPSQEVKPIKISWVLTQQMFDKSAGQDENRLGLCQCPGKKIGRGRNGKSFDRDIGADVFHFRTEGKVDVIICLLNKYELKTLGIDLQHYAKEAEKNGILLVVYPIIEMAAPEDDQAKFQSFLLENVINRIKEGKRVIAHCRGGIGRAGLLAACVLLQLQVFDDTQKAVSFLRTCRDKRCVESQKQMDYIIVYQEYLTKLRGQAENH